MPTDKDEGGSDSLIAGAPERLLKMIIGAGSWGLAVVIILAWLAGEFGFLPSQSKAANDAVRQHIQQAVEQQKSLDRIVEVLEEQRRIAAQAALIACLKEEKTDAGRESCIKKFPINGQGGKSTR